MTTLDRAQQFVESATLHELLRFGLSDFDKCEADPYVHIDMSQWYYRRGSATGFSPTDVCDVCLAGSVLRQTFQHELSGRYAADPDDFSDGIKRRLLALDQLRNGRVDRAMLHLRPDWTGFSLPVPDRVMPCYHGGGEVLWRMAMNKLLVELKEANL